MDITLVELIPIAAEPPAGARPADRYRPASPTASPTARALPRRAPGMRVLAAQLVLLALLILAVRVSDARAERVPRLVPSYAPAGFDLTTASWSDTMPEEPPGEEAGVRSYGHVGPDGRLDRWLQITAWPDGVFPPREPEVVRNGRRIWVVRGPAELQGMVEVPGCPAVAYRAALADRPADAFFDALSRATCPGGIPAIEAFAGLQHLCTWRAGDRRFRSEVMPTPPAGDAPDAPGGVLRVEVQHWTCPLVEVTGNTVGRERVVTIGGRTTVLWFSDQRLGSSAMQVRNGHRVMVDLWLPAGTDAGVDIEAELVRVVESLETVQDRR